METLDMDQLEQVVGGASAIELIDLAGRAMRASLLGSAYREPLVDAFSRPWRLR